MDGRKMTALPVSSDQQNAIRHHKSGIKAKGNENRHPFHFFYLLLLGKAKLRWATFYKTGGRHVASQPRAGGPGTSMEPCADH